MKIYYVVVGEIGGKKRELTIPVPDTSKADNQAMLIKRNLSKSIAKYKFADNIRVEQKLIN